MTLVAAGPFFYPQIPNTGTPSVAGVSLLDAAAEKLAYVFPAPKAGTLDGFEFLLGTVTQAPTNGLKCSFQDPSGANGDPDGVVDQFQTLTAGITTGAWLKPTAITSDGTVNGTKRTVGKDEMLAAVIEFASFNASDSVNVAHYGGTDAVSAFMRVYVDHFTAAWSKQTTRSVILALKYSDGTYGYIPGAFALTSANATAYNSGSTPNERGLYFSVPMACKVGGAWVRVRSQAITADYTVTLYDTDGTSVLAQVTQDGAIQVGTAGEVSYVGFSEVTLVAGSLYRLAIKPTTVNNINIYELVLDSAGLQSCYEGGSTAIYTQRTGAGAWTQDSLRRPALGVQITMADDGASVFSAANVYLRFPDPVTMVVRT